jgi:hypothetical protein
MIYPIDSEIRVFIAGKSIGSSKRPDINRFEFIILYTDNLLLLE